MARILQTCRLNCLMVMVAMVFTLTVNTAPAHAQAEPYPTVPLNDISPFCIQAVVAVEQQDFYTDPTSEIRAFLHALENTLLNQYPRSGTATITRQVATLRFLRPEERDLRRWLGLYSYVYSIMLSLQYTRDDLMAMYLNYIYWGDFTYGIEAAAQHYFSLTARELNLGQCALLASMIQAPALLNPFQNLPVVLERRAYVLDAMVEQGYVTQAQADEAEQADLQLVVPG